MARFERHVFVCGNTRDPSNPRGCCAARGANEVREALKNAVKAVGLTGKVRINQAGCLDQCEHGPTVVVYPDAVWYGFVKVADARTIVEDHLRDGRPVVRLQIDEGCINAPTCPHRSATPHG